MNDFTHGLSGYANHHCRCSVCKRARTVYGAQYAASHRGQRAAYQVSYRATPAGKAAQARYEATPAGRATRARCIAKHPITAEGASKRKSRNIVTHALRDGRLTRQYCSCGSLKAEAHHVNYAYPFHILWRCGPCHRFLHLCLAGKW